uniref:Semialdehyde dehydrogenase NAD-binding domain-containing protein n=1 Tax=Cannabis sativa TaxID=3483 RepID=A0A803NPD3_CANSA
MSSSTSRSFCFDSGCLWKDEMKVTKAKRRNAGNMFVKCSVNTKAQKAEKPIRIGVLGASGYTGSEIVRLLVNHPHFGISFLTADRKAGQPLSSVFPHLITQGLPNLIAVKDADFSGVDAVFCCLPHGTTQDIIKGLPKHLKIVDLSADFRLRDISEYEEWYGQPHRAPDLQVRKKLCMDSLRFHEAIKDARLVANPGCYPDNSDSLFPLLKGEVLKESNMYAELAEGIYSYGVSRHRHVPEIEQGLSDAADSKITISFTRILCQLSADDEFVVLLEKGIVPRTHDVRGSNYCLMNVFPDRIPGRAIIISVIDNLLKGASGQAMQNLNLMLGLPESTGLLSPALFP